MANYLINAGTGGIALSLVEKLLGAGHKVFITGRNRAKVDAVTKKFNISGAALDLTDFIEVNNSFDLAKKTIGPLYGVVNCAGSLLLKPAHLTSQAEYDTILDANLKTAFAVVAAAGKHLSENGGSVVLVSSAAAIAGIANHEAIAAAKGAIISLALSAAATYASSHIRFNVVAPGLVESELTDALVSNILAKKASIAMHAMGRLGTPKDIASAIFFFLDSENSWVTGQVLAIDGGLSKLHPKIKL